MQEGRKGASGSPWDKIKWHDLTLNVAFLLQAREDGVHTVDIDDRSPIFKGVILLCIFIGVGVGGGGVAKLLCPTYYF